MKTTFRLSAMTLKARVDIINGVRRDGFPYRVEWDGESYLLILEIMEIYCK